MHGKSKAYAFDELARLPRQADGSARLTDRIGTQVLEIVFDPRHRSWHVQDGTTLPVLQQLGGWEDINVVRKYAHLGDQYLAGFVDSRSSKLSGEPAKQNGSGKALRHTSATPDSTTSRKCR